MMTGSQKTQEDFSIEAQTKISGGSKDQSGAGVFLAVCQIPVV